jgi:hypothetical protein
MLTRTAITRTAIGLALIVATASGSLAATRPHAAAPVAPVQNVYNQSGVPNGWDPDPNVRLNLQRDWDHGR